MTQKIIKILAVLFISLLLGNIKVVNSQVLDWSPLGSPAINGTNGVVKAFTRYNGNIIVTGSFTYGGDILARNIAMWNGSSWSPLGSGIGSPSDTVYSLVVYNGDLYAGGNFTSAGGTPANNIARWNGSSWSALGSGTNAEVRALIVYNAKLYAGGEFDNAGGVSANRIGRWNGTVWSDVGGGFNTNNSSKVYAFTLFGTKLVAGGRINTASGSIAVNNVAAWDDLVWSAIGSGFGTGSDRVFALTVNNNILYAGGKAGTGYNISQYSGSSWTPVGGTQDNDVNTLCSFKGLLIAGGNFHSTGNVFVDRIAQWNGVTWSRLSTGMNEKVYCTYVYIFGTDTSLYVGGEFTTSGGKYAKHISRWGSVSISSVSGSVKYSDNNQPVASGTAKILRRDVSTLEVIIVDSAVVSAGNYLLPNVPGNPELRVIIFPNDVLDYVPTYFPSTVDWAAATALNLTGNLTNINVNVFRIDTTGLNSANLHVGGYAYLNYIPPQQPGNFPYNKDAIVYLKQGSIYKGFGVSNTLQQYNISRVPAGTYNAMVYRVGYQNSSRQINVSSTSLDTVNFYLDTSTVAAVHNISSQLPDKFHLEQNYPNPFNPETTIKFSLTRSSLTRIAVYNLIGQQVAELINESLQPGTYDVRFNGSAFPSGIYFYKLVSGDVTETKKMLLIK